jgi:type II secretory pathway predicted ATPase ExeA
MLPAAERLPGIERLIEQQLYFVLHAPRQTGKTTAIQALAHSLTAAGQYAAVLVSAEVGAAFNDKPGTAEEAMLNSWRDDAEYQLPADLLPPPWPKAQAGRRIGAALGAWAEACPRPLVVFIDEIDALENMTLISVLRQLRDGYRRRPQLFPASVALIGLRDVRDYKVASGGSQRLNTASPFNIKAESLTLHNFTHTDVATLYHQHSTDTGQVFTADAIAAAFDLTQGQPWLVNALARLAVTVVAPDPHTPITPAVIAAAKERLIQRQDTHLDSLAERLREPRVRAVIEPMLAGGVLGDLPNDDLRFVQDLGLVRLDPEAGLTIANPIYREVIPRVLANTAQASLPCLAPTWLNADGSLNPTLLLDAFVAFWRQHGQPLLATAHYYEIAPHIVLMAFLHRVVNGGDTLEREYAIGTRRMDLCLRYGAVTLGMELKVWRDGEPDPVPLGLAQLDDYLNGLRLATGWLVVFDQRRGLPPIAERTSTRSAISPAGRTITVLHG